MRKLVGLLVVVAVLGGIGAVIDVIVRDGVETAMTDRIEARSPGSHATVKISSFPFLGHLAVSGTVPSMRADITNVTSGSLTFSRIDLRVTDLKVSRNQLLHGEIQPLSIAGGTVTAVVSQRALDAFSHLPLTLGAGTVTAAGIQVAANLTIVGNTIVVDLGRLPGFSVPVPALDVLPCVGSAQVVPGALQLSCSFTQLPGLFAHTTFHA